MCASKEWSEGRRGEDIGKEEGVERGRRSKGRDKGARGGGRDLRSIIPRPSNSLPILTLRHKVCVGELVGECALYMSHRTVSKDVSKTPPSTLPNPSVSETKFEDKPSTRKESKGQHNIREAKG